MGKKEVKESLGLRELTLGELGWMVADFQRQMESGLRGTPESLAMLQTPFEPRSGRLPAERTVVSLDLGGTWLRTGIVETNEEGILLPPKMVVKKPIERVYPSLAAFIDALMVRIKPLLEQFPQANIGFVFSFPFETVVRRGGLDGKVIGLTKGWRVPGIEGCLIGKMLLGEITDKGLGQRKIAVLNDTIGTCLACEGTGFGGVVATGTNFAVEEEGKLRNIESGNYNGVPSTRVSEKVDELLVEIGVEKGTQLAEKQIAGDPLVWSLYAGLLLLGEEKIIGDKVAGAIRQGIEEESFSAANISLILTGRRDRWERLEESLGIRLEEEERDFLETLCLVLRRRSTQIVGAMVAAILEKKGWGLKGIEKIPISGALFWKMPQYEMLVRETIEALLPERKYEFVNVGEYAGLRGAAVAALRL